MHSSLKEEDAHKAGLQRTCYGTYNNATFVLYKRRWLILAVFSVISMTNEVIWISLSSIASIMQTYYGVSYVAINWHSMIYMIFYIFVLLAAFVLNTKGLKFTLVIGATLNALGSCFRLIGCRPNGFAFAFVGNASAALAQCFILFVPPTLAASWFGDKERATASAIGMLMNMFGVAVGFLMGGMIVPNSADSAVVAKGMFAMLLVQAVVCTTLVFVCVLVVQDAPKSPPSMSQALIVNRKQVNVVQRNCTPSGEASRHASDCGDTTQTVALKDNQKLSAPNALDFFSSLRFLARHKDFHLLTQAYGFYFGLFAAYNTILNQMCTSKFPGEEKKIGLMGFTSIILGLCAIFMAGIWIDKTRRYKLISITTMLCCVFTMLAFTLALVYSGNVNLVFGAFCVFGFFSYPYMTVGLEHAADVTYPIPEGTTSGILLLVGNIYGVALTYVLGAVIDIGFPDIAGYIMAGCYVLALICVSVVSSKLTRTEADLLRTMTMLHDAVDELSKEVA